MVSYCCVKGCSNNSNNKKKDPSSMISFHAFPSNQELKNKWLRAIGRPNWVPPSHSRVCSAHFNYDQINYDGCRIRIKDDVFPVNLLPSYNIEGLPQYVCYQCAPYVIKCNKIIEKSMIAQATLLDIFAKNGQITKSLIKKQNRTQLNLESPLNSHLLINDNDYYIRYNDVDNISNIIKTKSISHEKHGNIYYKNENETDLQDFKSDSDGLESLSDTEENDLHELNNDDALNNHNDDTEESVIPIEVIPDSDLNQNCSLQKEKREKKLHTSVELLKKKPARKNGLVLTPDETDMLKYFDIVNLSLREQIEEWKKTRQATLANDFFYECDICFKKFASANSYRVHVPVHDPSQGGAECPVCKLRFKNLVLAMSHARRAHSKKFFCKSCPKAFNNVGVAKKHYRWHSGYLYKCGTCSFSSVHESSLVCHRRRAHVSPLACALCGRACLTRRALRAHTNLAHPTDKETKITKEYLCEQCNIDFASEGARRVHILTSRQHRIKPDLCEPTNEDPNLHNTCRKCGTLHSSRAELVAHTRTEHPRTKQRWRGDTYPSCCELCGETVSSRKKHWLHVRRQHPKQIDTYQPIITAVCDTCGKGFQNSTKLRLHQLRHRSPTVRCHSCPRMFYDKYALARHALTHNADRPHQCRTCGRAFKLRSNLDRHFRVHTDIAPYECTMCGKKFKYSSGVNLHVRTVHYKLPHPPRKKRSKLTKDANDL